MNAKRYALLATAAISSVLATGCTTPSSSRTTMVDDDAVLLSSLGPAVNDETPTPDYFVLGAGDNLGQAVFTYYVAYLRASNGPVYATGQDPLPVDF